MNFYFINKYGFWGTFYLIKCWLFTKFFSQSARLIRLPFDCRNKKNILFGENFTTGKGCRIEVELSAYIKKKILIIGNNVQLNDNVHITAAESVVIGNNVLIASKVYISDVSHGEYKSSSPSTPYESPSKRILISNPVFIADNVWLGDGVCVLPGVKIGYGSIVGANSVVNKNIPPLCICVGIPAKVIKKFNQQTKVWESLK